MNTNHFYFDSIYRPDENLENQFFNNPSFEKDDITAIILYQCIS